METVSRKIEDLTPTVKENARWLIDTWNHFHQYDGITLLVYCTWRPSRIQAMRYRVGRPYSEIKKMADRLNDEFNRPDLATLLLGVGPQFGPRIVTNAAPGMGIHEYRRALDAVPQRFGNPIWLDENIPNEAKLDRELWDQYGRLAKQCGFTWGGDWKSFKDRPHIQESGANWREEIKGSGT